MPILETKSLTRSFGDLTAVDHLSLTVDAGATFGLLGPNGAGKTTVLKMLTTLLPPTQGTASIAGFDILKQSADVRSSIGYVPQLISADPMLTGYENLLIFAKLYNLPHEDREQRIRTALEFMGLDEAADKLVKKYSGGMIRRLEIAQSILHRPKVLFLDEPTVGLDPVARKTVWDHIDQLRTDFGTTIFLTTHFMEEADVLCERVAIMNLGKVVALGSPQELKDSVGGEDVTLDDVFVHYTGNTLDTGGGFREVSRTRRTARRLG
ncbi:MAG: ATP-binding cassette domain-containing protein [Chloroflexi bacterium]|nr:ATP-binding cassette domain-containing protein [Chloroflexota bacterium]